MEGIASWLVEAGPSALAWGGFIIGVLFGFTVQQSNFCSMGSLSDIHNFGDWTRFRVWMLAIAVAAAATFALQHTGIIDLSRSMYATTTLPLGGAIIGGLMFGFGMVFGGGCATRNLVRVGSGDLRSLIVLMVMGLFAYMTIGGLFGPLRVALIDPLTVDLSGTGAATQTAGDLFAAATGMSVGTASTVAAVAAVLALLAYCFKEASFRSSSGSILAGIVLGLLIGAGWMLTGLAFDELAAEPVALQSLTLVRPTGDILDWLMRYTAAPIPDFGVSSAFGIIAGAFAAAMMTRRFKFAGFADRSDMVRNLAGAAMMGMGGVLALGCTVGQGMTGVSTLAIGSMVALGAIIAGGMVGLRAIERMV